MTWLCFGAVGDAAETFRSPFDCAAAIWIDTNPKRIADDARDISLIALASNAWLVGNGSIVIPIKRVLALKRFQMLRQTCSRQGRGVRFLRELGTLNVADSP
jgi:hypothetical protein